MAACLQQQLGDPKLNFDQHDAAAIHRATCKVLNVTQRDGVRFFGLITISVSVRVGPVL